MKKFALAALMALPFLGMTAQNASAGGYCCDKEPPLVVKKYFVPEPAVIYDRDSRDAGTRMRLKAGSFVFAKCRPYGWCELDPKMFDRAWVMEDCLVPEYYERQNWRERSDWRERREPLDRPVAFERPAERPYWGERSDWRERREPLDRPVVFERPAERPHWRERSDWRERREPLGRPIAFERPLERPLWRERPVERPSWYERPVERPLSYRELRKLSNELD